ncbi:MAG: AAA family ATPase [Alphaproteobacteria bacterium]|nr:AAA family ATPase [Alphaproteobacteria bacterium]MBU1771027.1 AAA family ATPase [Alphaproteobacteria bacterium]
MRAFPHFVLWRYIDRGGSKPSKVPFSPRTGQAASVTDATTWASFDETVAAFGRGGFDGIGFVFSDADPFTGIDLDDCHGDAQAKAIQDRIFDAFPSYAELSPSGNGLHIIVKGCVRGSRRGHVEVYSNERFFTMTGKVYRDAPIIDGGANLATLMSEIAPNTVSGFDASPLFQSATETDEAVFNRAASMGNGEKFIRLWNGDPSDLVGNKSGSAIDQALVNILQFWTKDPAQIERMWLASPQGQRDKTQQRADYRRSTIARAFDRTLPTHDFSHLLPRPDGELPVVMATALHGKPVQPREWHVADTIPARNVTLFSGDGGTGKSLAALQLAVATVLARAWFGAAIQRPGGALFLTAEDDVDEVHRRLADIVAAEHIAMRDLHGLAISSLAGLDAVLAAPGPVGRALVPTEGYAAVRAYIDAHRPALVVLDTLADLFGGDEVNRPQVRQFIAMLRAIAIECETTIVLLAHPSVAGMSSGSGLSGSTAWNNSVRSRLYMTRENEQSDVRLIEVMKANYGAIGQQVRVKWERGAFVLLGGAASASQHRRMAESAVDELFLELLGEFEARQMVVSPQWQSRSRYVAKLMEDHPKANGVPAKGFYEAMIRLKASGRIEERYERINRRETLIIATVPQ